MLIEHYGFPQDLDLEALMTDVVIRNPSSVTMQTVGSQTYSFMYYHVHITSF